MSDPDPAVRSDAIATGCQIDMIEFRSAMREADLEEIIEDLIAAFVEDAPGRFAAIEAAVCSGDVEAIRATAHAYKSSAATMYACQLADLLQSTELAGKRGDADKARDLLPRVRDAHEATMDQLRGELA